VNSNSQNNLPLLSISRRPIRYWYEVRISRLKPRGKTGFTATIYRRKGRLHTMSKPTHEQAQLHLQVYEMRREARLRQARDWFFNNYFVDSMEDSMRIAAPGTENGAFVMMVFGYWDQACALLNYGLLHEDLFFETSGEFFGVWERVRPILQQGREMFGNKQFLGHLEKAANRYETWMESRSPGAIGKMREFGKQMRTKAGKAA
jgi:hypothetical protein